ncbi:MAG TPA: choice-of-anchor tandem repeat GloVer-containing protein [Methylocella sp.]|nr:choice-of-anchor tandem repeat GloVer-containing protein [Methylocella sp.]
MLETNTVKSLITFHGLSLALAIAPTPSNATGLTTLHQFTGGADGAIIYKGPTRDEAGNLYGEAFYGANACPDSYLYAGVGCGVIWKLDTANNFSTLVTFTGTNGADPYGNIALRGDYIYDTTYTGGSANLGTILRVKKDGTDFKTVYIFTNANNGEHPDSILRFVGDVAYSTAPYGGKGFTGADSTGNGVLFQLTSAGVYNVAHYFTGGADGGLPQRPFLHEQTKTLFGSTTYGGSCSAVTAGCGVVYSYNPLTQSFKVLYTFTGTSDGSDPRLAGVLENGEVYGATVNGGAKGYGTLFKLTPGKNGGYTYTHLYDFTGGADGGNPLNPALLPSGELIGGTSAGGSAGAGVLWDFKNGKFTTLNTFLNDANGGYPFGTPVVGESGVIYGTAAYGGISPCYTAAQPPILISSYGCGTVYRYTP